MPPGRSRAFRRAKNDLIYVTFRLLSLLVGILPLAAGVRLGGWIGRRAYDFLPRERLRTREHLRIAFGEALPDRECDRIGRASFDNLGRSLVELIAFERIRPRFFAYVSSTGQEHLTRAVAAGRGAIVVTAHTGNWEMMGAWAALSGFRLSVVARETYDQRLNEALIAFRRRAGITTILRGDRAAARQMIAALRRSEVLALVIDQDTKVPGDFVEFFGRKAYTPIGAAQLARKLGAPVLPAFCSRRPEGGLHVELGPPFSLVQEGDPAACARENTQRFTAAIERHIRAHPDQWVWMHRRWKTRPGGLKEKKREPKANPWLQHLVFRPLYEGLSALLSRLSPRTADRLGDAAGDLLFRLLPGRRRIAEENLRIAFGDRMMPTERERIIRETFRHAAKNVLLYLRLPALDDRFLESIEVEGREILEATLARGEGVLLVGGHIGSWELALFKFAHMGHPLHLIAKRIANEQLDLLLVEARRRMGVRTIYHRDSVWQVMRALKRGEPVVAVMDQNMKKSQGVFATFFGKTASTVKSTAALVARTKTPVLLGYSLRLPDGRHRLVVEGPLEFQDTGDVEADILANTQRCNDALESVIRRYPDQWFWVHRRWKTQP